MKSTDIPVKIQLPFGQDAATGYINAIPVSSQIGVNAGYASYTDGFVPLNATPVASGGIPPRIPDVNGILNAVSAWSRWMSAGSSVPYDATFQAQIGGYPKGSIVRSASTFPVMWESTAEDNMTDPDASGAGWSPYPITENSIGTNGYIKFACGLIVQWGRYSSLIPNQSSVTIDLPIPFPNGPAFSVQVTPIVSAGTENFNSAAGYPVSASQISLSNTSATPATEGVMWIAVGS